MLIGFRAQRRLSSLTTTSSTLLYSRCISTVPVFSLAYEQPLGSPIDTSRTSAQKLYRLPESSFQIWPNFLSPRDQLQLLRGSLQRLDEIRGVPREIKRRRRALQTSKLDGGPESTSSFEHQIAASFLPVECYDFSQVKYFCYDMIILAKFVLTRHSPRKGTFR